MKFIMQFLIIFILFFSISGCSSSTNTSSKNDNVDISQIKEDAILEVWQGIINSIVDKDKESLRKYLYFEMQYEESDAPEMVLDDIIHTNYPGDLSAEIINIEIKDYKPTTVFDAPGLIKVNVILDKDNNNRNIQFDGVFDKVHGEWKVNGHVLGFWYKPSDYED